MNTDSPSSPSSPGSPLPAPEELQAQAAAAGPEAQNNLGVLYVSGRSFLQDYQAAALCFRQAAERGFAVAQTNLARMYAQGEGRPKDEVEAGKWFRRAANQGDPGAQFHLGISLHRLSLGVPATAAPEAKIEGFMWLQLAAAQGFHNAESACGQLNLQMSKAEIDEARRRVAKFVATPE